MRCLPALGGLRQAVFPDATQGGSAGKLEGCSGCRCTSARDFAAITESAGERFGEDVGLVCRSGRRHDFYKMADRDLSRLLQQLSDLPVSFQPGAVEPRNRW